MNHNAPLALRSVIPPPSGVPTLFWQEIFGLAFVAIAYWFTVRLGLLLVAQPEGIASIWPASGLTLATLLLRPKTRPTWSWWSKHRRNALRV